jgi:hypothetical protein
MMMEQADRLRDGKRTDRHDTAISLAFTNFANAPKIKTRILGSINFKANKFGVQHTCYVTHLESKAFKVQQAWYPTHVLPKKLHPQVLRT